MKRGLKKLIGQEMSFMDLDNKMMAIGYLTVFDSGNLLGILEDGTCAYTQADDFYKQVLVTFEITVEANLENEHEGMTIIKITNVENL